MLLRLMFLLLFISKSLHQQHYEFTVDVNSKLQSDHLIRFWSSTGFSPSFTGEDRKASEYLLSKDEMVNLAYIGSLPSGAIEQVRIHWLIDLVEANNGEFNFDKLDLIMDQLWNYNLKPGFEVMGSPNGTASIDLDWKILVRSLAEHLVQRYGLEIVSTWNFESWNEPDHNGEKSGFNMTLPEYLQYYDDTREALKSVSPRIRFGGPGGSCRPPSFIRYCHGLLNHLRKSGNLPDFVSYHLKGNSEVDSIVEAEKVRVPELKRLIPNANVTFFNDEADPLVSWWTLQEWRGNIQYPALVARHIILTKKVLMEEEGLDISIISNDNGFMNFLNISNPFAQRTLLARIPHTSGNSVHITKPIFHAMSILSMLGDVKLQDNSKIEANLSTMSTYKVGRFG